MPSEPIALSFWLLSWLPLSNTLQHKALAMQSTGDRLALIVDAVTRISDSDAQEEEGEETQSDEEIVAEGAESDSEGGMDEGPPTPTPAQSRDPETE